MQSDSPLAGTAVKRPAGSGDPPVIDVVMEALSSEEYAAILRNAGENVHLHDGVWWRMFRPFFCVAAWVFTPIPPRKAHPLLSKSLGGYYHFVPPGSVTNGKDEYFVLEPLDRYRMEKLPSAQKRRDIRVGLRSVEIKRIERFEAFSEESYPVYLAWARGKAEEGRIASASVYGDRIYDKAVFDRWIWMEFVQPKHLTIGAYFEGRLVAFVNGYGVEETAVAKIICSNPEYSRAHAIDALLYTFVKISQNSGTFQRVINGRPTVVPSLDQFKRRHGFVDTTFFRYAHVNSLVKPLLKLLAEEKYRKLTGQSLKGESHV